MRTLSNSSLSQFKLSPKHLLHYWGHGIKTTDAMALGSLFHCQVLEPENTVKRFVKVPNINRRTKIGKQEYADFELANKDRSVLNTESFDQAAAMQEALFSNTAARDLLDRITESEKMIEWKDPVTGLPLKGILDGVGSNFALDLKTCKSAQPEAFARSAFNYDYHRQAALYVDGSGIQDFYFIAVEKEPPYGVSVHYCSKEFVEAGRRQYQSLLENYLLWESQGMPDIGYEWHTPFDTFKLELPAWYKQ